MRTGYLNSELAIPDDIHATVMAIIGDIRVVAVYDRDFLAMTSEAWTCQFSKSAYDPGRRLRSSGLMRAIQFSEW